jgi:sulfatase maturation enzyme AslB (radical SAM superfamily)
MHEVYPVKKLGVTLKSKDAIVIHRLVTQREPRVSKPKREKIPVVLKPCQQCGLVLAKRKFCSGACRQAAYRQRPLSPVQVKEKQARNQARVVISNCRESSTDLSFGTFAGVCAGVSTRKSLVVIGSFSAGL